jgi:hypothetical protein
VVESPRIGHAPPQHRLKRWPDEALMEGWFPQRSGEPVGCSVAKAAESRAERNDRSPSARTDELASGCSSTTNAQGKTPQHGSAVTRRVDAGRPAVPVRRGVCLDLLLHGRQHEAS